MFFLIRMAFWLGLILLILPIGTSSEGGREIGAWQAIGAVQAAISDARGFCQRQPDACAVGGDMIEHLADKAQAGAKWVYDAIGHTRADPGVPDSAAPGAAPAGRPDHDATATHSLTPQDLAPVWGGAPAEPGPAPATPRAPLPQRKPV